MNQNKPGTHKRIIAYLIDLLIITILSGILTIVFLDNTKYEENQSKILDVTAQYTDGEITRDEFVNLYDELNYELTKSSVGVTVITCTMSLLYYVILCYFCHGITLGKYFMKLRIVSNNEKELTILNYLLRSLVINMILSNILTVGFVKFLSKAQFIKYNNYVQNGLSILMVVSLLFIMYRKDGRGIEDFMGNTRVVDFKNDEVKDATIVEEQKENNKRK